MAGRELTHPISRTHSVPYAALTATFSKIDATTKRLEISAYLTHFLVEVIDKTPDDLLKSVYLCINRVRPLAVLPSRLFSSPRRTS